MLRFYILVILLLSFIPLAHSDEDRLKFDLNVSPDFEKFEQLLFNPSVIVMAFENIGLLQNTSPSINYLSPQKFQYKFIEFEFIQVEEKNYQYLISIKGPWNNIKASFFITAYLDLTNIKTGSVKLFLDIPGQSIFPAEFVTKLSRKLKIFASPESQEKIISYLISDKISSGTKDFNNETIKNIIFDKIRQPTIITETSQPTIIKKPLLIVTSVFIWFIFLIYLLYFKRMKRSINHKK